MTMAGDAQQKIETYLGTLRQRLRGMNDEDVREIVEELRSHILDKAGVSGETTDAGVDAALAALGSPEELASEYMTDNLLARAEVSRSPVRILESLFRWASLSAAGFFVLLGSMVGYFLGVVFILSRSVETISSPDRRTVAFSGQHRRPRDLSSAWIRQSTGGRQGRTRLVDRAARSGGLRGRDVDHAIALWCARQYRRSHLFT